MGHLLWFATYGNAGFMREQVCKYMCPYARFQSAMFDKDTLIVTYDNARGEPRGARSRKADPVALKLGACIDCSLCVQVCPTGIDIRKGLQYECIGCGACADICDTVMDKMGYARGLVKYSTQHAVDKGWTPSETLRHILRPRVLVYTAILVAVSVALLVSLALRTPLKVDVVRDRGVMARIVTGGHVENVYRLQLMNTTEQLQRYRIRATGLPGMQTDVGDTVVAVDPAATRWVPLAARVPPEAAAAAGRGSHAIEFTVERIEDSAAATPHAVVERSTFVVPR